MPRKYVRKQDAAPRAVWTQEDLTKALKAMAEGQLSTNQICSKYGIPPRTLRRRFANKNTLKIILGKHPSLDFNNEADLVSEILKLEKEGCVPTRDMLRSLAFEFAEQLGLEVPFCKVTRMAGKHWVASFLERHPEVKVRKKRIVPSGVQDEEEKRLTDHLIHCIKKRAAEILASRPKENDSVPEPSSSHISNDPLLIKIERSDDGSIEEPLENTYKLVEDIEIDIQECSSSKDILKRPLKEECHIPPNTSKDECDGIDLLFLGYAAAVKKLGRRQQITVKQEIAKIIAVAELSELE